MQTRLADIAQQAQVSTATVSRVLNGRPGVSGATRQSVLAALDMLGYERPASLTTKSVGLVGLVVPELTNPVFPAFVDAIEQRLSEERFTPLLCTQSPGGTSEDRYVEVLLDHAVNGIVFVSGLHADKQANLGRYQRLRNSGVPIVLVNGYNAEIDAPSSPPTTRPRSTRPSTTSSPSATAASGWPSAPTGSCPPAARSPRSARPSRGTGSTTAGST